MPQSNEFAHQVLDKLESDLVSTSSNALIIIAGDFNCTLQPEKDRSNSREYRKILQTRLQTFIQTHELTDPWREFYPDAREFTFIGTSQTQPKARLDRFYVNGSLFARIKQTHIQPTSFFTDHHPICLTLTSPSLVLH